MTKEQLPDLNNINSVGTNMHTGHATWSSFTSLSVTFEHAIGSGAQFMCWVLKELKELMGLKELKRYCWPIVVDIAAIVIVHGDGTIGDE